MSEYFDVSDYFGNKYNMWSIVGFSRFTYMGTKKRKKVPMVVAKCDCGNEKEVNLPNILRGLSRNCGCERLKNLVKRSLRHGYATRRNWTKEHKIWCGVMKRCYYKGDVHYYMYGGAGVSVAGRWHDFKNFIEDMGRIPEGKSSLDRFPNQKGNYEPGNCRWADDFEQSRNRSNCIMVIVNGDKMTSKEAERLLGLSKYTIGRRLKYGYTLQEAMYLPPHAKNKKEYRNGKTVSNCNGMQQNAG